MRISGIFSPEFGTKLTKLFYGVLPAVGVVSENELTERLFAGMLFFGDAVIGIGRSQQVGHLAVIPVLAPVDKLQEPELLVLARTEERQNLGLGNPLDEASGPRHQLIAARQLIPTQVTYLSVSKRAPVPAQVGSNAGSSNKLRCPFERFRQRFQVLLAVLVLRRSLPLIRAGLLKQVFIQHLGVASGANQFLESLSNRAVLQDFLKGLTLFFDGHDVRPSLFKSPRLIEPD